MGTFLQYLEHIGFTDPEKGLVALEEDLEVTLACKGHRADSYDNSVL